MIRALSYCYMAIIVLALISTFAAPKPPSRWITAAWIIAALLNHIGWRMSHDG